MRNLTTSQSKIEQRFYGIVVRFLRLATLKSVYYPFFYIRESIWQSGVGSIANGLVVFNFDKVIEL